LQNSFDTGTLRLVALSGAIACLGLAFGLVTWTPWPVVLLVVMWMASVPLLLAGLGWLGVWLVVQGFLWLGGLAFMIATGTGFPGDVFLGGLILAGLSALIVALVPPTVAARHRSAWPFGFTDRHKRAVKAKRDRLLMEEEIIYERVEDAWDDEADELFPEARKRGGTR